MDFHFLLQVCFLNFYNILYKNDKQTIDTILSWLKDDIRIIFDHRLLLNIKPVVIYAMQFVVCKDVYKILRYKNIINNNLLKEQKRMIKKMNNR